MHTQDVNGHFWVELGLASCPLPHVFQTHISSCRVMEFFLFCWHCLTSDIPISQHLHPVWTPGCKNRAHSVSWLEVVKAIPNQSLDCFVSYGSSFCFSFVFLVYVVLCLIFLVVSTSAIDYLERLVSDMTHYVSSGILNPTHSFTHSQHLPSSLYYAWLDQHPVPLVCVVVFCCCKLDTWTWVRSERSCLMIIPTASYDSQMLIQLYYSENQQLQLWDCGSLLNCKTSHLSASWTQTVWRCLVCDYRLWL